MFLDIQLLVSCLVILWSCSSVFPIIFHCQLTIKVWISHGFPMDSTMTTSRFLSDFIRSGPLNRQGNGYWKVRMEDGTGKAFRPVWGAQWPCWSLWSHGKRMLMGSVCVLQIQKRGVGHCWSTSHIVDEFYIPFWLHSIDMIPGSFSLLLYHSIANYGITPIACPWSDTQYGLAKSPSGKLS